MIAITGSLIPIISIAGGARAALHPGGVQLLLGHTKIESTARYFGIEVDDALEMAEQADV
jgi:hypothetical protein